MEIGGKKMKKLLGRTDVPHKSVAHKYPCKVAYRWDEFCLWTEADGDIKDISKNRPKFLDWPRAKPIEDWPLEMIRRKFYRDLKDAENFRRDEWMPKVMHMILYILRREMISIFELSLFLGMPKYYLKGLMERDEGFRYWIKWVRVQSLGHKLHEVIEKRATGRPSLLETIKHNKTGRGDYVKPYPDPIDVGWKPKVYSVNR